MEFKRWERRVQSGDLASLQQAALSGVALLEPAPFTGRTLMHTAAQHGKKDIVRFLLEIGMSIDVTDDLGSTPLIEAVAARQTAMVAFLCDSGADIERKDMLLHDALIIAKSAQPIEAAIVQKLLHAKKASDQVKEFAQAAADGRVDIMSIMLDKIGFAPDDRIGSHGLTPLIIASGRHRLEMVEFLIKRGADPNIAENSQGVTPLIAAGQNPCLRDLPVFESLLRAGAHPDKTCLNGYHFLEHAELNDVDAVSIAGLRKMVMRFKCEKLENGTTVSVPVLKKMRVGKG